MARNVADAADAARPKGEIFQHHRPCEAPPLTGTNRTRRAQPDAGAPYPIWLFISSMLKNFHEMFGLSVCQT
jgi:hypothetical protein